MHRLELDAHCTKARLDRANALAPVVALAHAEHLLYAIVERREVAHVERLAAIVRQPGETVPLGDVPLVCAQGDLRVDRGRAADAAAREECEHLAAW